MSQFSSMFPDLNNELIESVLRKYDGGVAQTIEELLERSAAGTFPSSSYVQQDMERKMINEERAKNIDTFKERVTYINGIENGSVSFFLEYFISLFINLVLFGYAHKSPLLLSASHNIREWKDY